MAELRRALLLLQDQPLGASIVEFLQGIDMAAIGMIAGFQIDHPAELGLDRLANLLTSLDLVKFGPLVLALLYTWLRLGEGRGVLACPERVLRGTLGILVALAAARTLQNYLPMRERPRFALDAVAFPVTDYGGGLHDWSSMPSDHAVLVGALAMAIWWTSRPLAALALIWGVVVVCLPRIYFGIHYLTDIIAGLVLGGILTALVQAAPMPAASWNWLRRLDARVPSVLVLGLFVFGWEIVNLFSTSRRMASVLGGAARVLSESLG